MSTGPHTDPASLLPAVPVSHLEQLLDGLRGPGWCVLEGWPPLDLGERLLQELEELEARGDFRKAGIGRETSYRQRPDIRGDFIYWLDPEDSPPASRDFLELLEELRVLLSRNLMLGLRQVETHLAIYPPATGYQKHLDRFADSSAREVTFVTYLNRDWNEEDGGLLRLYSESAPGLVEAQIVPRMGTTAFFLSGAIWHEVTATTRRRYSATGWFRSDGFTAPRRQELP